jgi:hypothetical protein
MVLHVQQANWKITKYQIITYPLSVMSLSTGKFDKTNHCIKGIFNKPIAKPLNIK